MSFPSGKPHPIRKNPKDEITSKFGKMEILQKEEEFQKGENLKNCWKRSSERRKY